MQSFPQPPSAKEEREYLKRCRAGDKDARNALIERNLRLVAYIARKYASMDRDMEDLISIGTIGLIKAVDSFDESKGIRLSRHDQGRAHPAARHPRVLPCYAQGTAVSGHGRCRAG